MTTNKTLGASSLRGQRLLSYLTPVSGYTSVAVLDILPWLTFSKRLAMWYETLAIFVVMSKYIAAIFQSLSNLLLDADDMHFQAKLAITKCIL